MTISVVIPAYNEERLLPSCLESLRSQTRLPDEIIVVDNNSTDKTAELALAYGARVVKEPVQGIMPAVHTGMSTSGGDIIARCDADSILPPNWIESIEKTMKANPQAAGVTGPGRFYGTSGVWANLAQAWYMYPYFLLVGSALANWPIFGSNCAIRRTVWRSIEGKVHSNRVDIHDDMEISMHIPADHRIIFKPSLVVGISARSLRPSGMSRRYKQGTRTLSLHWPSDSPWQRWRTRLYR